MPQPTYQQWMNTPGIGIRPNQDILSFLVGARERLNAPELDLRRTLGLGEQGVSRELGLGEQALQRELGLGQQSLQRDLGMSNIDLQRLLGTRGLDIQQRETELPLDLFRLQNIYQQQAEHPFALRERARAFEGVPLWKYYAFGRNAPTNYFLGGNRRR